MVRAPLWAAAATLTCLFYRRQGRAVAVVALGVGYSRMYVGVHWPTDVLAGFGVGITYALGLSHGLEALWTRAARRYFPRWWAPVPSLLHPEKPAVSLDDAAGSVPSMDRHWLRLGWLSIGLMFVLRLLYLNSRIIELSEDEGYQWLWSKHPDLSYYSKPPFIAYASTPRPRAKHCVGGLGFGKHRRLLGHDLPLVIAELRLSRRRVAEKDRWRRERN